MSLTTAEERLGEVPGGAAGAYADDDRARGASAITAPKREGTVERVVVIDGHPDVLELIAELHRVVPPHPGEVQFGVDQSRILPLGIRALAPKSSEAGNANGGQTNAATTAFPVGRPGIRLLKAVLPMDRLNFPALVRSSPDTGINHFI